MGLVKLATRRETLRNIKSNYHDNRSFIERNSGKLIGLGLGAATAAITKDTNDLLIGGGIGALVGKGFDNNRKITAFRSGDASFKKLK